MPVEDSTVEATLPYLSAVVADMIRLQRLTGMRPGEVCAVRPCDVDRSEEVWTYRPASRLRRPSSPDRAVPASSGLSGFSTRPESDARAAVKTTSRKPAPRVPARNAQDPYKVVWLSIDQIEPFPENDRMYGDIVHDEQIDALIDSIRRHGLAEPFLLTADRFVLSGHRRLYALRALGHTKVPVRVRHDIRREGNPEYHRNLVEFNPQRIKTPGSLLREALLRNVDIVDTTDAIESRGEASMEVDADFMAVEGSKEIRPVSDRRRQFLEAVQKVISDLRNFWPLSIRQIHYNLLNAPPLKQTPKESKFNPAHYRYRNDKASYDSLVDLLTSARYHGQVSMNCIDDPTRPRKTWGGFANVSAFVQEEVDNFLLGYHRDRQ